MTALSHMEALNTRLAAEQPVVPLRLPVSAEHWNCHAATTLRDASGEVLAECSGHGRHSVEDEAIAAEIVRRVNAHEELVAALRDARGFLASDYTGRAGKDYTGGALTRIDAAIARATGAAA